MRKRYANTHKCTLKNQCKQLILKRIIEMATVKRHTPTPYPSPSENALHTRYMPFNTCRYTPMPSLVSSFANPRPWLKRNTDHGGKLLSNSRRGSKDRVALQQPISRQEMIDAPSRLLDQHQAGEAIPGIHVGLEAAIHAT